MKNRTHHVGLVIILTLAFCHSAEGLPFSYDSQKKIEDSWGLVSKSGNTEISIHNVALGGSIMFYLHDVGSSAVLSSLENFKNTDISISYDLYQQRFGGQNAGVLFRSPDANYNSHYGFVHYQDYLGGQFVLYRVNNGKRTDLHNPLAGWAPAHLNDYISGYSNSAELGKSYKIVVWNSDDAVHIEIYWGQQGKPDTYLFHYIDRSPERLTSNSGLALFADTGVANTQVFFANIKAEPLPAPVENSSVIAGIPAEPNRPNKDLRPKFDKSEYLGSVWSHANFWFSPEMMQQPQHQNRTLITSSRNTFTDYVAIAHILEKYGFDGLELEPGWDYKLIKLVADAFAAAGNGRKVALLTSGWTQSLASAKNDDERALLVADSWLAIIRGIQETLRTHPNVARIDGRPIISLYGGVFCTPEVWAKAVKIIEKNSLQCIWLYTNSSPVWDPNEVRKWMPVMDGVGQYGCIEQYWRSLDKVALVMKREFPQKVFEGVAGSAHMAEYSGCVASSHMRLTGQLRDSWDFSISLKPDSMTVTNWSDFLENSAIQPSYQRWDSDLRICQEKISKFRKNPVNFREAPSLILTNKIDTLVGEPLEFEVLGFPVHGEVELKLELQDASGKTVHSFAPISMIYDQLKEHTFRLDSILMAEHTALFPVLRYKWNGAEYGPYRFRGTMLRIGNVATQLVWSTPIDRLRPEFETDWRITKPAMDANENAVKGDILVAKPCDSQPFVILRNPVNGLVNYHYTVIPLPYYQSRDAKINLLYNGIDFMSMEDFYAGNNSRGGQVYFSRTTAAPLEWISTEVTEYNTENLKYGDKTYSYRQPIAAWNSLPIWLIPNESYQEKVKVPIAKYSFPEAIYKRLYATFSAWGITIPIEKVVDVEVPKFRVPYFHYKFDKDNGQVCWDFSGHNHHGWLGDWTGDWQQIGPFNYNFDNRYTFLNKSSLGSNIPVYKTDAAGQTCIYFDGVDDRVTLPPRTVFPFAETWEFVIRPDNGNAGRKIAIMESQDWGGVQKTKIHLDEKGCIWVTAVKEFTYGLPPVIGEIKTTEPISSDKWTHIALVNNCRDLKLFINGRQMGETLPIKPSTALHAGTFARIGSSWDGKSAGYYKGSIREIRITGRPLQPKEFLK